MSIKECVNDLKNKLYTEVFNYEQMKTELENLNLKKDIFCEIIRIIQNSNIEKIREDLGLLIFSLPIIYGEIEGERVYNMLLASFHPQIIVKGDENEINEKKFNLVIKKILEDYNSLENKMKMIENQINIDKQKIIQYRKILSNYKYKGLIDSQQINLITDIIEKYNYEPKDKIRIFESIRMHNIEVKYDNPKISYTIVNMLDQNYQKYEIDILEKVSLQKVQPTIDSFIKYVEITNSIEDEISLMPDLKTGDYSLEEFDYFYKNIINYLIDKILDSVNSITDQSIYDSIELRKVVIQEYNELSYKYRKIKQHYLNQRQSNLNDKQQEENIDNENNKEIVNNIFYLHTPNTETSYLERDLKSFPEEYLSKVKELLERKKYNELLRDMDEPLKSHKQLRKFSELRDDQVRIIYKHIFNNNYLIIGAFVKKTDADLVKYGAIASRKIDFDITTEELLNKELENAAKSEEAIYGFIDENARKGRR